MLVSQHCPLSEVLEYQNESVVGRFTTLYNISLEQATDVFEETKKWLWLASHPESPGLTMSDAIFIIDEMWHNFILFTIDYTDFCQDHFGSYFHHGLGVHQFKKQLEASSRPKEEQMQHFRKQCMFISTHLGSSTLLKWFVEYPKQYNENFINCQRKAKSLSWPLAPEVQLLADYAKSERVRVTRNS